MEYEAATVDVCEKSLENVWSVVLVAGIFEIIQNVFKKIGVDMLHMPETADLDYK